MAYKVVKKNVLNPQIFLMEVEAPLVAKKAEPGQFIILRIDEYGERVPFTIADFDREKGTVTIIVQIVGKTTKDLAQVEEGEEILDFAGPLGTPTTLECLKKVSNKLIVATDDGSNGNQGFVTDMLKKEIEAGEKFDEVIAIGPLVMMKFVCKLTEQYNIPTTVSMNPVMIDGTGMCGGCRVIVGGETKFACVDGPDFDGHKIDWDTAMKRGRMFKDYEEKSCKEGHCRIGRTNHQD